MLAFSYTTGNTILFVTLNAASVLVLVPEKYQGEALVSSSCLADIVIRQFNVGGCIMARVMQFLTISLFWLIKLLKSIVMKII